MELLQSEIRALRAIVLRNGIKPLDLPAAVSGPLLEMALLSDVLLKQTAGAEMVLGECHIILFVSNEKFTDGHGLQTLSFSGRLG
jgi:hypothetical protein